MQQAQETQTSTADKYVHHVMDLAKNKVRDSNVYTELRTKNIPHARAFKLASLNVANNPDLEISDADRALMLVTAHLGEFAEAQHELRLIQVECESEGRSPTKEEHLLAKHLKREYVIPFNSQVKEFINTHPNEEIRTVSSALANSHGIIYGRHESINKSTFIYGNKPSAQDVFDDIQKSLDGMRHEVAAETLLDAAGYSYDYQTTTEDDAHGSDLYVYLESGWQPIDVKASFATANKASSSRYLSNAVWSGLGWEDFKGTKGTGHGTLSIPFDIALAKCDDFIDRVRAMTARNNIHRSTAVKNASHQAVRSVSK